MRQIEIAYPSPVPNERNLLSIGRPDCRGRMLDVDELLYGEAGLGLGYAASHQRGSHEKQYDSKSILRFEH